jgi:hypothetical protein
MAVCPVEGKLKRKEREGFAKIAKRLPLRNFADNSASFAF